MSRPSDPRKAARRGATGFGADIGYDVANDAKPKPKSKPARLPNVDMRPPLPDVGCRMYLAPSPMFGGKLTAYTRCTVHRPAYAVDDGTPVNGHCPVCEAGL